MARTGPPVEEVGVAKPVVTPGDKSRCDEGAEGGGSGGIGGETGGDPGGETGRLPLGRPSHSGFHCSYMSLVMTGPSGDRAGSFIGDLRGFEVGAGAAGSFGTEGFEGFLPKFFLNFVYTKGRQIF